jgi:hypothetical protein
MTSRLTELQDQWSRTRAQVRGALDADVGSFNALLKGTPAVIVPAPKAVTP